MLQNKQSLLKLHKLTISKQSLRGIYLKMNYSIRSKLRGTSLHRFRKASAE